MVVRDNATTYKQPANRILEPRARNAAKLRTPSRINAPTVSAKAANNINVTDLSSSKMTVMGKAIYALSADLKKKLLKATNL